MDWLDEIKARAAAASPGPWRWDGLYENELYDSNKQYVASWSDRLPRSRRNAEFCAHAREDIPRLIAEVERLRAKLAEKEA